MILRRGRAPFAITAAIASVAACGSSASEPFAAPETSSQTDGGHVTVSPLPLPGPPSAKPPSKRTQGVAFVHGTGDNGGEWAFSCTGIGDDFHCSSNSGLAYWEQATIDSERTRSDGTRRPWVAVGCALGSFAPWPNPSPVKPKNGPPEPGSSECVGNEIARFLAGADGVVGTDDDVDDLAIVTHSGGGNVVRYILQQESARPAFHRIYKATRGVATIASPTLGTYLADRVFGFGALSIGNDLFDVGYDDDGTDFIQTTKMALFNADPAKFVDLSKDVNGIPFWVGGGVYPDKDGDPAKVACGGETETKALNFVHELYFDEDDPATARNHCSDGFVSCLSATALANGDLARVMFGEVNGLTVGVTRYRAHNQTRRNCNGVDLDVRATVNTILESPAAGNSSAVTTEARERFVPLSQKVVGHFADVDLDAPSVVSIGSAVRIGATSSASSRMLTGYLLDPTGTTSIPMTFGRSADGSLASAQLPARARIGTWTAHVGTREALASRAEAVLPFWVSAARGSILEARATSDDLGVVLTVRAAVKGVARVGARATLVSAGALEPRVVAVSQQSVDADPHGAHVEFAIAFDAKAVRGDDLVVRDVALVSHDDASTLAVTSRVELSATDR